MTDGKTKRQSCAGGRRGSGRARKKRRRLTAFARLLIALTLLLAAGALYVTFFLRAETFFVEGKSRYSKEQIVAASGMKQGDVIFLTDREKAAARLPESLPYIASARICYRPLTGVAIVVAQDTPAFAAPFEGGAAILDGEGKVLETAKDLSNFPKLPVAEGTGLKTPVPGQKPPAAVLGKIRLAQQIYASLQKHKIGQVSSVNVGSDYELKARYDGRIDILIGASSDLDYKIRFAAGLLGDKAKIGDSDQGTLDVSQSAQSNRASFVPT